MATASPDKGPVRLPLAHNPGQRGYLTSTDAKLVNCVVEKQEDGNYSVQKRPGFFSSPSGPVGFGRGNYYWAKKGAVYNVRGSALYDSIGTNLGAVLPLATWFNESQGTPYYLYLSNGQAGYTVNSAGAFAAIASPNYPALTVYGSAFLDGTLYVMDAAGAIWGSNLNDPTSWSALNKVVAQSEPDSGVAIAKHDIYVVAFKQWTTEFFYNAGAYAGTLTGSSLLPVQNAKLSIGCLVAASVKIIDDSLFWIGAGKDAVPRIYRLRGLKVQEISTPAVSRFLEKNTGLVSSTFAFGESGHNYYMLDASVLGNADPTMNLVYDIQQEIWVRWGANALSFEFASSSSYPYASIGSFFQGSRGNYNSQLGDIYTQDVVTFAGVLGTYPILCDIITPNFDAGVKVRKTLTRLRINADANSAGSLQICWSDDDYKTWSVWRTVNLQDAAPQLMNLGTFRRRAFWFRHQANTPFRIQSVELDLLYGSV